MSLLELDGAQGEGGGQILRTSLALSLITGLGFHLRDVRAGRKNPGLQPQHLTCVRAASMISNVQTRGATRGSQDLVFEPGPVRPGKYRFDIGTAGSTSLVLHTVYLPLMFRTETPSELTLTGGTHVRASPCFHYLNSTWRNLMAQAGLQLRLELRRPGFYPRGGGEIEAFLQPSAVLQGVRLIQRGPVVFRGFSAVAGLPMAIARRQARRAIERLKRKEIEATIEEREWEGGPGSVLALELETGAVPLVFAAIGERGKPAERVADEAVDEALEWLAGEPAPIDPHGADQLILPLALADDPSEFRVSAITKHLTTNVAVVRQFLDRAISIDGVEGEVGTVRIG